MVKMARICDICGREIGTYNSRYSLTYKTVLYSREKDICPLCFDKLQEQFKEHKVKDEPQQTDVPRCSINGTPFDECGFCEHFNCDTCQCEADTPQTEEPTAQEYEKWLFKEPQTERRE